MERKVNANIRVSFFVIEEARETEKNTREGRSRTTRKEVVGCVQDVVGENKFLVQFKDG